MIKLKKLDWKGILLAVAMVFLGGATGVGIGVNIHTDENGDIEVDITQTLELSEKQVPAVVETKQGETEIVDLATVDEVDGGKISTKLEEMTDEERENASQGFAIDITTPWTVADALYNQCIYLGNPYGSQCVNTTNVISENQVGYWMSTCGTGAARGIWDCAEYNARGGYELITDPTQLRPGDLFVTWGGDWGHTGMVIGYYSDGYVPVFSTNQGGPACSGGGAAANVINLSMATFSGAFRWHGWDWIFAEPEPTPTPIPISGCVEWGVENGDTMSKIMLNCEGTVVYGEPMNAYARTWFSRNVKPGQSVYDGWVSPSGVGLYAGDWIDHRINGQ